MDVSDLCIQSKTTAVPKMIHSIYRFLLLTIVLGICSICSTLVAMEEDRAAAAKHDQPQTPPVLNFAVYRDRNAYPIDPRKPCRPCTQTHPCTPGTCLQIPGLFGRPHKELEPGACQCGKKCSPHKRPFYSPYWPDPTSAQSEMRAYRNGTNDSNNRWGCKTNSSGYREQACPECQPSISFGRRPQSSVYPRPWDIFDRLYDTRLIPYQRTDSPYCGSGTDPYGCLGESKLRSQVSGVGFRQPGEPVSRVPAFAPTKVPTIGPTPTPAQPMIAPRQAPPSYPLNR